MLNSIGLISFILGFIVTLSIVVCKYFNSPKIFLSIMIFISIFYQINSNKRNNKTMNFEETLINLSKFIILSGIFGYVVFRIIGIFVQGFD
jgi:hypothetical protein